MRKSRKVENTLAFAGLYIGSLIKNIFEEENNLKMKEKRYFCDWWDKNYIRNSIIIAIIAVFLTSVFCFAFGGFAKLDYPEEMYKELETAYIPYVHEGIGIDVIGLKKAVYGLEDPIFYSDGVKLIYGYNTAIVTIVLDENYNTISVERKTQNDGTHKRNVIGVNIGNYGIYTFSIWTGLLIIGFIFIYIPSEIHKWVDEKLSKRNKKRKNKP